MWRWQNLQVINEDGILGNFGLKRIALILSLIPLIPLTLIRHLLTTSGEEREKRRMRGLEKRETERCRGWELCVSGPGLTGGRCFSGGSLWPEYTTPESPLGSQPWPTCPLHSASPAQQGCGRSCWRRAPGCWAGTGHPAPRAGSWGGFHPKTESAGYKTKGQNSHVLLTFTSKSGQKIRFVDSVIICRETSDIKWTHSMTIRAI